jgi:hypothetical protein
LATLLLLPPLTWAGTDVLTNNYDAARTGANLAERTLNPSNVRPQTFGKVFQYTVDGPVLGQPLVATDLDIPGQGRRDVVFVVTGSNSVYAFDASGRDTAPLWRRQLARLPDGRAAAATGIQSTPVIDKTTLTLYVVATFQDDKHGRFVLHALDLRDGRDKYLGPVLVAGSVVLGGQRIVFEPTTRRIAVQRAALALAADRIIVAFGGDYFEGWVFAIDKADLRKPASAFCTTCASRVQAISGVDYLDDACILLGPGGGIWQAGRGPAVDGQGLAYFFTSNKQHVVKRGCRVPQGRNACATCASAEGCLCEGVRSSNVCAGPDACIANQAADGRSFDVNESLIVLDPAAGLRLTGWFRPDHWNAGGDEGLERNDLDLGASGPVLLPGTDRLIGGGKQGVMYLLDAARPQQQCLPSLSETCIAQGAVQSFQVAPKPPPPNQYYRHIFGGPVVWQRSAAAGGARAYVWRTNDYLRSYRVSDRFEGCSTDDAAPTTSHRCPSAAQGQEFVDQHPGAILSLSADADDAASGIVWASAYRTLRGPGRLMAFAAEPDQAAPGELPKIWDSEMCVEDAIESGSEFVPPTVANGRVYLATGANRVEVFGLREGKPCTPAPQPQGAGPILQ